MMCKLSYIPLDELEQKWRTISPFIMSAANSAGEMNEEVVLAEIVSCKLHLFTAEENGEIIGAATVRIIPTARVVICLVVHLGGDWDKMLELREEFATWAKAQGAEVFRIQGRRGWKRKLEPLGFKEKFVTMEMKI
jgi:hypothetical protein